MTELTNPIMRVQFHISSDDEKNATLKWRAAWLDDEANGQHQTEYTLEQALSPSCSTTILSGCSPTTCSGRTVEEPGLWDGAVFADAKEVPGE